MHGANMKFLIVKTELLQGDDLRPSTQRTYYRWAAGRRTEDIVAA